jgi:hypothetical protein
MSAADLDAATPPSTCALVLSLPLTRADFDADLLMGEAMDYSRHNILVGRSPEQAWNQDGAQIATVARELATVASELGVLVCCAPTLSCISALFRVCSVVTVVAHWRGASLRGSDFRREPKLMLEDIGCGRDELRCALAQRLDRADIERVLGAASFARRAALMAELLNKSVIDSDVPLPGCAAPNGELVYRPWLRFRHRQLIDAVFSDLLSPGNQIELRDGLYAPCEIAEAIPENWSGIVDLALCQSAAAAKVIKDGRTDRRVAFNNNEVVPGVRLRILRDLYQRLDRHGGNYAIELAAIFRNLRDLAEAVTDAVASGDWGSDG